MIEVLSPSTDGYDRGDKFARHQQISSLEEYVLVAQDHPRVVLRVGDGTWSLKFWAGPDAVAQIRCLPVDLPLAELYERVAFGHR